MLGGSADGAFLVLLQEYVNVNTQAAHRILNMILIKKRFVRYWCYNVNIQKKRLATLAQIRLNIVNKAHMTHWVRNIIKGSVQVP